MSIGSKEIDHYKISLIRKQDWLDCIEHQKALDSLFKECLDREEVELVFNLIMRFKCTNDDDYHPFYVSEAKRISRDNEITINNSFVIPTTKESADSSLNILTPFNAYLKDNGLKLHVLISMTHLEKHIAKTAQPNVFIIIVEDFVGSGTKVMRVVEKCKGWIKKNTRIKNSSFQVISLATMENGKKYLTDNNIGVFTKYLLKRGITDHYIGSALNNAKRKMLSLESLLWDSPQNNEYSFGYKKTEAAYVRVEHEWIDPSSMEKEIKLVRTPNDVFPIFWWSKYVNREKRTTLLQR